VKKPKNTVTNTTKEALTDHGMREFIVFERDGGGRGAAIEHQEKRGQQEAVKSDTLPTRGLNHSAFVAMGIKIGKPVPGDSLFTFVELPKGWKKQPTDHTMYSDVVDEKGRKRASFFYKAAYYDRDANIYPTLRYEATYEPVGGWKADGDAPCFAVVKDSGNEIWRSQKPLGKETTEQAASRVAKYRAELEKLTGEEHMAFKRKYDHMLDSWPRSRSDMARSAACDYLDQHFPKWGDYLAYWD